MAIEGRPASEGASLSATAAYMQEHSTLDGVVAEVFPGRMWLAS
jgi:hypothetical protein